MSEWIEITEEFLNSEKPEWFSGEMWVYGGSEVTIGRYEWEQGWDPHRIIANGYSGTAIGYFVMPLEKPKPPEDNTNKVFKCYCGKTEIIGRLGCCKDPDCIPY